MASTFVEPRGVPTIFGEIFEKNVTFCVDTSGSMYKGMEMVKEHLVETLNKMGNSGKPYMFNIIEFNSAISQWSDKLVTCTPQTVTVAKEWISKLAAKTGTNTKGALITALQDPLCDAVYLVTDGLPDHHPVEILDHVASIGGMRPVHCIYLSTEDGTDSAAVEFLEDLAIESYGSFHIITLTTHGCVERITPIYRSEHAQERIIRTLNGTIRPNVQRCSVATTLAFDPDESLQLAPRVTGGPPLHWYPSWGPYWGDWLSMPYRYYYPYAWSRYRPARGWIKSQEQMMESIETQGLSPAAGALLINKSVLARRMDDGYFYKAFVKSQILSDKFLVGFGPCKHGKFKETTYQDTHVYDIIDYEDAKVHAVLTGDYVLAPWEPEGERFGPGTVIEGHEKRSAEGPDDKQITVSFTNGRVEKVAASAAIWVPKEVHERITLELKMPREARQTLKTQNGYPQASLEGYPTSGPDATPQEYELPDPLYFDYEPTVLERPGGPWRYPFHPPYPLILKDASVRQRARIQEVTQCTGTSSTAAVSGVDSVLAEKVASQLIEHKQLLDEAETEKGTRKHQENTQTTQATETKKSEETVSMSSLDQEIEDIEAELNRRMEARRLMIQQELAKDQELLQQQIEKERLLKKRVNVEENTLKKSVTFTEQQPASKVEETAVTEDSGFCTARYTDQCTQDGYYSDPENLGNLTCDQETNTDSSLLYRGGLRHAGGGLRRAVPRPPWKKYWRADPSMPTVTSNHEPFRETALQAPLEARDMHRSPYVCEWTSPVYRFVDPQAKHNYTNSVEKCLRTPSAPPGGPDKTVLRPVPVRPMSADTKEAMRRDFKRRKEDQRRQAWDMRMKNYDQMNELMEDQHKERILAQMGREKKRQMQEQRQIEQSREQKKFVSKEIRERIETNQQREVQREEMRIRAMQRRREHREQVQQQREKVIKETEQRRAEVKAKRSQERWDSVNRRLDQEEAANAQRDAQHHAAKLQRIEHFSNLEEQGQLRKDVRIKVTSRHQSMFESVPLC